MESQNIEFRAVIKFLTKEGAKAKEIHWRMADVYGDSSPKYSTVAKWSAEFKRGRDSLEDDPRPGHPADVISQEMIDRVERLVLNNRRIKVAELASERSISNGSVYTIIHEHLGMSKSICQVGTQKPEHARSSAKGGVNRPRWLSWMRRPTGDQEVAGSTPAEVGNILSWRLIMKYFLRSFSPFR